MKTEKKSVWRNIACERLEFAVKCMRGLKATGKGIWAILWAVGSHRRSLLAEVMIRTHLILS